MPVDIVDMKCRVRYYYIMGFCTNLFDPTLLRKQQLCNISLHNKILILLWHLTPAQLFAAIKGRCATSLPWGHLYKPVASLNFIRFKH